ncbi:hypothetical protein B0H21DRAFT_764040 [Amylocystis lapponica]|nr:hypothetical protein B0H21DRAFT_764040 [Amylocystis lapponica]
MSDEYTSSGFQSSLVNESADHQRKPGSGDYMTSNYPPPEDSTSSGGYGSSKNTWSNAAQRGREDAPDTSSDVGLVDQSKNGGPFGGVLKDAQQGEDEATRRIYAHEAHRDFDRGYGGVSRGLNPYGRHVDTKGEAAEMLASGYRDARARQYESGPAATNDGDVGA